MGINGLLPAVKRYLRHTDTEGTACGDRKSTQKDSEDRRHKR